MKNSAASSNVSTNGSADTNPAAATSTEKEE
jgi:hypothetical protein